MSQKTGNVSEFIPDQSGKQSSEDKQCEPSMDSGYLSGYISSSIYSGEIMEEPEEPKNTESEVQFKEKELEVVQLDSGLCLSEDLSHLSLKDSTTNDLSSKSKKPVECGENVPAGCANPTQADIPWEIFFQQDEDGDMVLHLTIVHGLEDYSFALIRMAPHPRLLDTPNDDALTPLHLAVACHQWRVVRWLVVAGARPGPRNLAGDSPLHLAVRQGDVECCKAILYTVESNEREQLKLSYPTQPYASFDLDQWNYDGQTCVHIAAQNGNVEILRQLVWHGANINAREGREGFAALHYAVKRNDENLLNFLLNECDKIDLNITTYGGRSALQLGFSLDTRIFQILQQKGVDSAYSSEEEYSSESDDDIYENIPTTFSSKLVDASA